MTLAADERAFATFSRGDLRDDILSSYRYGLRKLTNPETGAPFTEDEIALATAELGPKWIEAEALDLVLLASQSNAQWLADQMRPERASTAWLDGFHIPMWLPKGRLEASGGSGEVSATLPAGTVVLGSTTVPDPAGAAHYLTDPAGLRYQVLFSETVPAGGVVTLTLKGIDVGPETNLRADTKLSWAQGPTGATEQPVVTGDFSGGTLRESDPEVTRRILRRIRRKKAAGNNADLTAWAEESAKNAIEVAFTYACAHHAGSSHVTVLQKRSTVRGPLARIPSAGTLASARAYLTPPGSPVVPARAFVPVTGPTSRPAALALSLELARGSSAGWKDGSPWPVRASAASEITALTGGGPTYTVFRISSDAALPAGVTAPSLMVWRVEDSSFERLPVSGVTFISGTTYEVTLTEAKTLALGDVISPDTERRALIADTLADYFDELGPGEIVDLEADPRGHRAFRFPTPAEEYPAAITETDLGNRLEEALGASLGSRDVLAMSPGAPSVPADPLLGPELLTLGKVGIYAR